MSDYDNSNRISLWRNDKRKSSKHPHLRGQGETDAPVWASAWFSHDIADDDRRLLKEILARYDSKRPFLTISLQPKQERAPDVRHEPPPDEFNDEIPF